jgi:hypothetical protein
MKIGYVIEEYTAEVKNTRIAPGCTYEDNDPVTVERCTTEEAVLEALEKYETRIKPLGVKICRVTEYVASCILLDADGDYYDGAILDFTRPEVYVNCEERTDDNSKGVVGYVFGPYNSWKDAEWCAYKWKRLVPAGKTRSSKVTV